MLQFYLDNSGLPHLDKASVNESYLEDAPAKPVTKPAEGKEEVKKEEAPAKVKKERNTLCMVKIFEILYGLPQSVLNVSKIKLTFLEFDSKRSKPRN